ncbi:MAG: DUF86 domain-containing protein [Proteobacteria bacterium]|jgi:uncharacterized protein with HEPN domain|nr:DUF86 domain-containing protein [Pseudomonadota bacterium]
MQHDKEYLLDILEAAKLALFYIGERTKDNFLNDFQCQDAVIRRLEIIGEAARRISEETRKSFPELPWCDMVRMRNVMIHDYDDVDLVIVWETVKNDLPQLIDSLKKILQPNGDK